MRYLLSALALFIGLSGSSAKADTYEVIVNNFDGFGSSANFYVPSFYTSGRTPQNDPPQFLTGSLVYFTYQTGATIPNSVRYGMPYGGPGEVLAQGPAYFAVQEQIGFESDLGFIVGPGVQYGLTHLYNPLDAVFRFGEVIYTVNGDTATLNTGTFGNVTVVNATPEPSSLMLLGTGVLGAVGVLRKKLTRS